MPKQKLDKLDSAIIMNGGGLLEDLLSLDTEHLVKILNAIKTELQERDSGN